MENVTPSTSISDSAVPPMPEEKRSIWPFIVVGTVVATLLLILAVYFLIQKQNTPADTPTPSIDEQVACTLEAKICPDGSAVGRTGPNCEFAPCPIGGGPLQTIDAEEEWQTYSSNSKAYQFSYPASWNFVPFQEDDSAVEFGSHTLSNYSPTEIEQYMDHGVVNWAEFLGEISAVKLDVSVSSVSASQRAQFEAQLSEEGLNGTPNRQNQSNLQIANLSTTQLEYAAPPDGRSRISTYFAYPNEVQAIMISVFVNNTDEYFEQSTEWANVKQIFQSFVFGK